MKTTLKITLLIGVCILGFLLLVPLVLKSYSKQFNQHLEKQEAEQLLEDIEKAKQTGTLNLYPPFLFGSKDFHATKKFAMLQGLTGIRELYLCGYPGVPVAKNAIEHISSMSDLEEICFQNVTFEKDAMTGIYGLPKLHVLALYGCKFDVPALEHIATLTQIETLKIFAPMHCFLSHEPTHTIEPEEQTKMVETLARFTHLKKLNLPESFRSDEETLRQYLPDTEIEFNNVGYDIP